MGKLAGKTILITGANKGIGFYTALGLAKLGPRIIMVDKEDLSETESKIVRETGNTNLVKKYADFSSLNSIRSLVKELTAEEKTLNVLINNVGIFSGDRPRSEDGLQLTMQVNHFGPFLLSVLLEDLLKKSAPSRMIFVSSLGAFFNTLTLDNINDPHINSWDSVSNLMIYYNSKLCNMIVANCFARRLLRSGVTANSVHPGMTGTEFLTKEVPLSRYVLKYFTQDPQISAQGSVFLASSETLQGVTGKFFVDCRTHQMPRAAENVEFANRIWDLSEYYVGLKTTNNNVIVPVQNNVVTIHST